MQNLQGENINVGKTNKQKRIWNIKIHVINILKCHFFVAQFLPSFCGLYQEFLKFW